MLLGEHGGGADERCPHPGRCFEPGALLCQRAARKGNGHAGRALAVDGGADIDRGICFPDELHQGHGKILPADGFRRGSDVKAVGQYHINNEAERHAREHHQAELVITGSVEPPQQGRDRRQQHEPAAIRKNEPLVEGDEVIHRGVDDVFGVGYGRSSQKNQMR